MTQAPQPTLKAIDFLGELPRRLLTDTDVDDNLYRELVKGKSWDRALSILCDVEACNMYPALPTLVENPGDGDCRLG